MTLIFIFQYWECLICDMLDAETYNFITSDLFVSSKKNFNAHIKTKVALRIPSQCSPVASKLKKKATDGFDSTVLMHVYMCTSVYRYYAYVFYVAHCFLGKIECSFGSQGLGSRRNTLHRSSIYNY